MCLVADLQCFIGRKNNFVVGFEPGTFGSMGFFSHQPLPLSGNLFASSQALSIISLAKKNVYEDWSTTISDKDQSEASSIGLAIICYRYGPSSTIASMWRAEKKNYDYL